MSKEDIQKMEPVAWGDPEKKGILGRSDELDHVIATGQRPVDPLAEDFDKAKKEEDAKLAKEADDKKQLEADSKSSQVTPDEEVKPDLVEEKTTDDSSSDDVDDDLKGLGDDFFAGDDKDSDEFDVEDFDAETNKIAEAIEKAGHPGEPYRKVRERVKELESKLRENAVPEEAKKEIEELRLKAEEVDSIRERLKEISAKDAQLQLESSDEYRDEVLVPVREILDSGDQIAQEYGVDAQLVQSAIREPDLKKREEIINQLRGGDDGIGVVGATEIGRLASKFTDMREIRRKMLAEAEERVDKSQGAAAEQARIELENHRKTVRSLQEDIWDNYKGLVPGLLNDKGEPTAAFEALRKRSLSIDFSNARAKDQAFASFSGVILPHALKELKAAREELASIKRSNKKEASGSPSPSKSIKGTDHKIDAGEKRTLMQDLREVEFTA